ncbi:MAG: SLBB domain-containing protein, partial [Candidatus Celaenobacter polaris]|nr:SLBB domain-containing protein [Candidatus Celaenobacter polaris]
MKKQIFIIILILLLPFILFAQSKMNIAQSSYQMIQYNVSVVGNVVNPGTYTLSPIKRISDAIQIANSAPTDSVTVEIIELLNNSSTRNITLKRKNENIHVDLERFLRYGDDKHNPYIQDGDIIIVPAIERKVTISGSVNRGGEFELVKKDRIFDIIMLSMGLSDNAYLNKAEVVRFINDSDSTKILNVNLKNIIENPESQDNLLLENDDRIFIQSIPEYHKRKQLSVSVFGAVINGGEFDLTEGYRLYDAITVAGGLRDDAYL